jgi:hypothetical protein
VKPATFSAIGFAAYRFRLLGLYDETSGEPIENADVIETTTGLKMLSSRTGTVCLWYVPDGGGLLRIQKAGYEARIILVSISAKDTTPVTLTLAKAK